MALPQPTINMSEAMVPPAGSSLDYLNLHTTALAFIDAQAQDPSQPQRMNFKRIEKICTTDYEHSWGHNYAVSMNPRLQGTYSFSHFTKHLEAMLPNLESWETTVTDVLVDEAKMKVMLRVSFWMVPKGSQASVENDLLWMLEMNHEGRKVKKSTEFVDGIAAGRLKEIMMGGKA
ncbi:hypothetical protein HBI56_148590 [Parastagonospora nodorum]|nr:hypothetical protein HBH53_051880 [Parastagonospora nodorum]KAH3983081.1 hypothetical protein HBH52_070740 [Parastagonospora nodorum]KAH4023758.1 hypothetical protein HBI09_163520 [Parastagonospora nodorum]KAH4045831.1 hypothetical protein HBH49_196130 [Parastagonospora nodorum]KAH4107163.1 hypothetical protein HBH46_061170 [Parastagonospora nodorum]